MFVEKGSVVCVGDVLSFVFCSFGRCLTAPMASILSSVTGVDESMNMFRVCYVLPRFAMRLAS